MFLCGFYGLMAYQIALGFSFGIEHIESYITALNSDFEAYQILSVNKSYSLNFSTSTTVFDINTTLSFPFVF